MHGQLIVLAWLGLASWVLLCGCKQNLEAQPGETSSAIRPPWFEDVTAELGLDFVHDPGPIDGEYFMPQIIGSGAALCDLDNDGRLDIYLLQNGGPQSGSANRLFRQLPSGRFEDISAGSGLDVSGYCMGVAVGDVNNDGWPDVYLSEYGAGRLFLNLGQGRFEESSKRSNVENPMWGVSASFLDFDRDGWLDLFVVNYVNLDRSHVCQRPTGQRDYCHPRHFKGSIARLYRNLGPEPGSRWRGFEDVTGPAGLAQSPGPGLGALCVDFNGDGWTDIFVANDAAANHLWINQRNGTFIDEAVQRGVAFNARGDAQGNMGVAWGDVDGDVLPELFVTHLGTENHGLWKQEPKGLFQESATASGLTQSQWHGTGWGTTLSDFDHDGALDLALVNGSITSRQAASQSFWDAYEDRNQVFSGDGAGKFQDISEANPDLCKTPNVARAMCVGDIDADGDLDLLVTQIGGPAKILRNIAPLQGRWLIVRAVDPEWNRDAIGAEIHVRAGNRVWSRFVQPGQGFLGSNDPRTHFGLGNIERIEYIEALWPDGSQERFPGPALDGLVEIQRGTGQIVRASRESR